MQPLWACAATANREMTVRTLFTSGLKKAKQVLQQVGKAKTHKVEAKVGRAHLQHKAPQVHLRQARWEDTTNRFHYVWQNSVKNVYFRTIANQLGRRCFYRGGGRNVTFLAFAGLVYAQNSDTENDEVVGQIQSFIKATTDLSICSQKYDKGLSLDRLDVGSLLGQGCNAAVYEACLKPDQITEEVDHNSAVDAKVLDDDTSETASDPDPDIRILPEVDGEEEKEDKFTPIVYNNIVSETTPTEDEDLSDTTSQTDSDITILSMNDDDVEEEDKAPSQFTVSAESEAGSESEFCFISEGSTSSDDWTDCEEAASQHLEVSDESGVSEVENLSPRSCDTEGLLMTVQSEGPVFDESQQLLVNVLSGVDIGQLLDQSSELSLQYQSLDSSIDQGSNDSSSPERGKYDLAVKMMFNYDIVSNSDAIIRAMRKEAVPARLTGSADQLRAWYNGHKVRLKQLPAHPNIVDMLGIFVDSIPDLPDAVMNYPAALPHRINPHGMGRNMTLFLVMKKYSLTLSEYLSVVHLNMRERLYLLVQLLEAVDHMVQHGIAHRDIKADNVLIDTAPDGPPQLVLCDFGCCLADPTNGLRLPYPTEEVDRGGNSALMAPEIASAKPGTFVTLDYSKADLWGVGALAYEILGADNPFYTSSRGNKLDSRFYRQSELPPLPIDTPQPVQNLVTALLQRDPSKRPTPRLAADVLHFYLWSPGTLSGNWAVKTDVTWWLITMATEVNLESLRQVRTSATLMSLKRCFIERFNINRADKVLKFLDSGYFMN